ncbi:uncharacterized protein VTP21DRAFT_10776 [Calcarisporiella thermophila]|uniref:uncharacterized protein n=1 Tax=Calcarisporiella thermophila TaxID=911321 RepID=UPI0037449FCF
MWHGFITRELDECDLVRGYSRLLRELWWAIATQIYKSIDGHEMWLQRHAPLRLHLHIAEGEFDALYETIAFSSPSTFSIAELSLLSSESNFIIPNTSHLWAYFFANSAHLVNAMVSLPPLEHALRRICIIANALDEKRLMTAEDRYFFVLDDILSEKINGNQNLLIQEIGSGIMTKEWAFTEEGWEQAGTLHKWEDMVRSLAHKGILGPGLPCWLSREEQRRCLYSEGIADVVFDASMQIISDFDTLRSRLLVRLLSSQQRLRLQRLTFYLPYLMRLGWLCCFAAEILLNLETSRQLEHVRVFADRWRTLAIQGQYKKIELMVEALKMQLGKKVNQPQ